MSQIMKSIAIVLLGAFAIQSHSTAQDAPRGRVLVIGIDGLRPDALKVAKTPALDELIANGFFSDTTKILGSRYRENNTVSGPGWSSFLTGVWADKHGVNDNSFDGKNYESFPHFFARIKEQFPTAITGSFVDWEPIDRYIVRDADVRKVYPAKGADGYTEKDMEVGRDARELLERGNPHAVVAYFGAVDETGHRDGFHPSVPTYVKAIETVDSHVARLLEAMQARPNYRSENWLVLVSTDHGGRGTGHGDGHEVPEINTTFLIVSGSAAKKEKRDQPTFVVDLPVTALHHLGVKIDPGWKLDGSVVGLK